MPQIAEVEESIVEFYTDGPGPGSFLAADFLEIATALKVLGDVW